MFGWLISWCWFFVVAIVVWITWLLLHYVFEVVYDGIIVVIRLLFCCCFLMTAICLVIKMQCWMMIIIVPDMIFKLFFFLVFCGNVYIYDLILEKVGQRLCSVWRGSTRFRHWCYEIWRGWWDWWGYWASCISFRYTIYPFCITGILRLWSLPRHELTNISPTLSM